MQKKIYICINISLFCAMTVVFILSLINFKWGSPLYFLLRMFFGYIVLKFLEMVRLYIIFLEYKINFKRFLRQYVKCELLNLLGFPLGNKVLQGYLWGYELGNWKFSIIGLLIDMFYCVASLTIVRFIFQFLAGQIYNETILVCGLLGCIVFLYVIFIPVYVYFNRFLILHSNSPKAPCLLEILERIYDGHRWIQCLLEGRSIVLLIISCIIAWLQVMVLKFVKDTIIVNNVFFIAIYLFWTILIISQSMGKARQKV